MLVPVCPLLHTLSVAAFEVSVTLPPSQKVVGPFGVMIGVEGNGNMVTLKGADEAEVQPLIVVVTTKVVVAFTAVLAALTI